MIGDYIFFLDVDEEITDSLRKEIQSAVDSRDNAIWSIYWAQISFGKSLSRMRKSGGVPRMFKRSSLSQFEGVVHEGAKMNVEGLTSRSFKALVKHYTRDSIYSSILKLGQYSQLGVLKRKSIGKKGGVLRGLASAFVMFFRIYLLNFGFLCAGAGFLY